MKRNHNRHIKNRKRQRGGFVFIPALIAAGIAAAKAAAVGAVTGASGFAVTKALQAATRGKGNVALPPMSARRNEWRQSGTGRPLLRPMVVKRTLYESQSGNGRKRRR